MDIDQPSGTFTPTTSATPLPVRSGLTGSRRLVASMVLAIGLLTVGGVAIVSAASPSPGASSSPTSPSGGGTQTQHPSGTCPNM
jgi:hypothetical protein